MNVFDYMNLVSGYVINKLENKKDFNESIEFLIKPVRDPYTKELFYEVSENVVKQIFYLKFPCSNKEDFYNSVKDLLIEYIKNSGLFFYSATNNAIIPKSPITSIFTKNDILCKKISLVTKNMVSVSFTIEDEKDELVFNSFKTYLDQNNPSTLMNLDIIEDVNEEFEETEEVVTLSKIML